MAHSGAQAANNLNPFLFFTEIENKGPDMRSFVKTVPTLKEEKSGPLAIVTNVGRCAARGLFVEAITSV